MNLRYVRWLCVATGGADNCCLHHEKAEQKLRWCQDEPSLYVSDEKVTASPDSGAALETKQ